MQYKTLALSLAASAMAAPTPASSGATMSPAPTCEQFGVAFMVADQLMSANVVQNGTGGAFILEAERLSVYPGTHAYMNSSNPAPDAFHYKALNFVHENTVYGAFAINIGDEQGVAKNIELFPGTQQFEWQVNGGNISHQLFAAPNGFYACKDRLVGAEYDNFYLRFGDYNFTGTGSPPAGCTVTQVYQDFNVPGGLTQ